MRRRKIVLLWLALGVVAWSLSAGAAGATVIAGNVSPSGSFDPSQGYLMDFMFLNAEYPGVAVRFTPETDVRIELVELALTRYAEDSVLFVSIAADDGGLPSWMSTTDLVDAGSWIGTGLMPWAPGTPLELEGGTPYWLVAEAEWYDVFWHWSDPAEASDDDLACNGIACNNPGPGSFGLIDRTRPAFRITGSVIPEPGTGLLLGLGLALLAGRGAGGRL